jgi:hypothetical protein
MEIRADKEGRRHLYRVEKGFAIPVESSPDSDPDRALEEITRSAQHITGASGAALALSDGKVVSCTACSGYLAPPVGTRLNTDSGLTATCVQTGEVVRCDDTETDSRIDSSKCIGIRSILVVPVFNDDAVAGVLEVLSSKPQTFTDRHVTALRLLARLVENHVNFASRGEASLDTSTSDPRHASVDNADAARVGCLSCGHRNPQGSQFCNRCGVILCISDHPPDGTADLSLPQGTKLLDNDGLREIYKLISGSSGLATWNDIYAKLLANQQNPAAPDKQGKPAPQAPAKSEDIRKAEGNDELTARAGAAMRRSIWL